MQLPPQILQTCWFLTGPTACGKSELGLLLAAKVNAEIVSLDSMAIYRGMAIGTAKPTREMRNRVAHHLVDIIDPHEEFSVVEYIESAHAACREILDRGRVPLFVGGTGLYLRSILRGVFEGPPADWSFRRELQQQAANREPKFLHKRLEQVDSTSASNIHPNDSRRVIRALEVHHLTGRPLSEHQQHPELPEDQWPQHVYWLSPDRDWLYERINRRVENMISDGLVNEVRNLLSAEKPLSRTARQALGYKEVIEHVDNAVPLDETIERIQTRTRQFAKRQHTWFRNLEECRSFEIDGTENASALCDDLLEFAQFSHA